jgi:predicted house-cleaning noncanonical NTP pyrophosphatase (MazG superfamily)
MEDGITFETLNEEIPSGSTLPNEDTQLLRNELITLAEKHEIKHSAAYIRKASHSALEKIKGEYERKQLEETNEFLTETLMGKLSEFMEEVNMIDDAKSMEEELTHNKMVKKTLKTYSGMLLPSFHS